MEAVAAGDHVAAQLVLFVLVSERDHRRVLVEAAHGHSFDLEQQRQAELQPDRDQILHDLRLAVDHDRPSVRQLAQRDAVPLAVELHRDAVVDDPLPVHALTDAGVAQQLNGSMLEHACADSVLDVVASPVLEDDRIDPRPVQQVCERQPGRPGADDPDLCAQPPHRRSKSAAWPCPTPTHIVATP